MTTQTPPSLDPAAIEAFHAILRQHAEAIVAAFRAAVLAAFPPQCIDADGNLCPNWQDILANPLDPPRG